MNKVLNRVMLWIVSIPAWGFVFVCRHLYQAVRLWFRLFQFPYGISGGFRGLNRVEFIRNPASVKVRRGSNFIDDHNMSRYILTSSFSRLIQAALLPRPRPSCSFDDFAKWQSRQSVCRFAKSYFLPPRYMGMMWSTSKRPRRSHCRHFHASRLNTWYRTCAQRRRLICLLQRRPRLISRLPV